jgi:hypothetical protein
LAPAAGPPRAGRSVARHAVHGVGRQHDELAAAQRPTARRPRRGRVGLADVERGLTRPPRMPLQRA